MKTAVIVFPGSNCDRDLAVAIESVTGVKPHMVWHGDSELPDNLGLIAVPGGFSYGDYLRCGAIAARSPVVRAVVDAAGRLVGLAVADPRRRTLVIPAATVARSLLALRVKPSGSRTTSSPWDIQLTSEVGRPSSSVPGSSTETFVRPYSRWPVRATWPPSACAIAMKP